MTLNQYVTFKKAIGDPEYSKGMGFRFTCKKSKVTQANKVRDNYEVLLYPLDDWMALPIHRLDTVYSRVGYFTLMFYGGPNPHIWIE